MNFRISDCSSKQIEINTLAELKAYALGGTGVIKIDYVEESPMTGYKYHEPHITQVEE